MTFRAEMQRYFERYAYQTRHGTEAGRDLVLDEALNHVAAGCAEHITADRGRIADLETALRDLLAMGHHPKVGRGKTDEDCPVCRAEKMLAR